MKLKRFQIQRGRIRLPRTTLGFVAAAVMVMVASMAFAAVQEFTNFTLDIPDGWTAKEDGPTVGIIKDDQTASLAISLDALKPGDTLGDLANAMSQYMKGTEPEVDADGDYSFTAHDGQIRVLITGDDSNYLSFTMVGLETESEAIGAMINSMQKK